GGHSLLATRVASRLRQVFGIELPVRALFEGATVARLAERVEEARRAGAPAPPPVLPVDRAGPLPLSFGQERLWFVDRLEGGSPFYHIPEALRLTGALDVDALERALGEIVRRHEPLRTVFRDGEDGPVQVIHPFAGFALSVEELCGVDGAEREAALAGAAEAHAALPFDLAAGPLFRARLLRLGAGDHALLLCMHHVVSDGWSLRIFFQELSALYAAYRDGAESPLPEPAVQYADFAAWQRTQLSGDALDRQLDWWKGRLAGAPTLMELPADRPRPATRDYRGAMERLALPASLAERLRALGRGEAATLYMVLLGAFQVLLGTYCGGDDVVVGSPVAGRTRRETEGLIGFFVNSLVMRTRLDGDPAFREVLRRVREAALGAYEHQDLPFERLVAELQPERSLSHSPLFQAVFALQNAEGAPGGFAGLDARGMQAEITTARFDLTLDLSAGPDGIQGVLVYATDLFERGTIQRMLVHLRRVLEQVVANPDLPLSRLSLLDADERRAVVHEWNRTERPYPRGVCIHERFAAQAAARPQAVALAWEGVELTYEELDARTNRLAHHLARLGVQPDAPVGVLLERGVDFIVSILAVLKAGGGYVPLDPTYPAERLRLMLADAGVRVVLSHGALRGTVDEDGFRLVCLDEAADALAAESAEPVSSGATADNLAYIVYTSGSTGRPKGVMVGHREILQLVVETDFVALGPGDRVAQASNASFDALAFEAWGALLNGATLVGIGRETLLAPAELRRVLRDERITTLYQTTALLNQLSREQPDIFAPLREVLFGGQAVDPGSLRRILAGGKPERLLHVYGPTETTAWCSFHDVQAVDDGALTVSVGRPIGNARIYVLDAYLQPVPPGVPGEAYVGGAGVVRGYLDRPSLTASRFVPDPFGVEPGARMYRTGDRMRWMQDGTLEFIGRLDQQVKLRGFRIEPGEIESVLSTHPGVREARVVVREDEPGEQRLVAYVVGDADADELRGRLRQGLPEYMVPTAFVALDRLPLTAVGKLDVRALPAPELGADGDDAEPRTEVEAALAEIWSRVLRVERVGVRQSFFELGGHSLLFMRLIAGVQAAFGVELAIRTVFATPTVRALAAEIESRIRAEVAALPGDEATRRAVLRDRLAGRRTGTDIPRRAHGGEAPLSFAQERLWFLDRLQQGGTTYNIPAALRLSGGVDEAALERALGEIVRRHEALRTVFHEVDGVPAQLVAPFAGFTLPVRDLSGLEPGAREAEVARLATEDATRPFDLTVGPLFRAALLRLGGGEHALLLCMHHIVSDGWSLRVLFGELAALYEAYRAGDASPLDELPVQYADYAAWQRGRVDDGAQARQLAYWTERLSGAPELLELPADRPRPPVPSLRGAAVPVHVSPAVLEGLRALAGAEGATLYMVALAAFQVLLGRYGATDDVVVGTPVAGRTRAQVEALIGLFVNTLVLRTSLAGDPAFREVVGRARDTVLGAYDHQDLPFERLVAELRPERSLSHSTLFQVMFMLDSADGSGAAEGGALRARGLEAERGTTKFDLTLALQAGAGGLTGVLDYSTDLFDDGTARRMVEHLERLLEQVAADPDRRIPALALMGAAERDRVLGWNRTAAAYPADRCIHQLFEAQAARTPDATALVSGAERLTYAELDGRANRLARHLRGMGVGPEVRVGICLERGPELMAAILGVMKAGGAYVPMDPAHPAERIDYMLGDSGVAVLLTQERLRGRLSAREGMAVLAVDSAWAEIGAGSAEPVESGVTAENLCYVIYTSGSTGRPKGVAMHHRGVSNYIDWGVRFYGADRGSGAPVFTSMAVDLTVTNLLPLFAGHPVTLLPEESPVEALAAAIRARPGYGLIKITPIHLGLLNTMLSPDELAGAAHTLVVGADFLSAEPTVYWQQNAPGVRLMNEYGPTETVVGCSAYLLPAGRHLAGPVPVGGPIQNLTFHVLDARMEPVPVGLPGELYIGGAGVARGYLGRPALSAEKFVPDPFAEAGARMYRTGDRARWQADGNLMILGRTDNQVKVRGYRVELGEIEAVLRRRPEVRECMVAVREDRPGDRRLVAYVVAPDGAADAAALREHARETLPEYMVPSAFVVMDALPQTSTGKLDRKALPAPEYGTDAGEGEVEAPRDEVEALLVAIWEALLGVRVGPTQSFFDLGGNSFLALRLFAQVNRQLECDLPVATLFAGATVRRMAEAIRAQKATAGPRSPVVPMRAEGTLPPLFCVHPADRRVIAYVNLVRHLGAEQPVYGVQDLGDDLSRPVAAIAAEHVEAI
ncbi:MAG TPA: amino acid adenylation domain-containing protein, partial [Longimicrobium sp.]|nr:amino acid adenylation domain-containing protein [Longimicrobium sp.]